jgi:hypothetical protein
VCLGKTKIGEEEVGYDIEELGEEQDRLELTSPSAGHRYDSGFCRA